MSTFLIYFAVFVAVLIGADTILRLMRTSLERRQFINYRLGLIEGNADRQVVYRRMLKERGVNYGAGATWLEGIRRFASQSGLHFDWARIIFYGVIVTAVLSLFLLFLVRYSSLVSIVTAALVTAICGTAYVARARSKRTKKFLDQLPEALEVIVRSLSAGHPISVAVALVSREMADPIGSEFGIMSDEMTYGTDIDAAARNMAERTGVPEMNLLAISLSVQRGAGGNLAEMLANLADMIRRRLMLRAKIRAISVEGRMTSWFMLFFPFGLYLMLTALVPDYFDPVWASGYGTVIVGFGLLIMAFGMLILRKIVNFDY